MCVYMMFCVILLILLLVVALAFVLCAILAMAFSMKAANMSLRVAEKEEENRELRNEIAVLQKENEALKKITKN